MACCLFLTAAATAIPETVMAEVPHSQAHRERTGAARGGDGDKAAQQDIEDVKAREVSSA